MTDELPKIKLSDHQSKRMADDAGHRYDETDAKYVIDNAEKSGVQTDGRLWSWAQVGGKHVLAVVSATVSASVTEVYRVVTAHIRPKPPRR